MECLYCRKATDGTEGRAHVLPEALLKNELTLPVGSVCDACNHYLGKRLDSTLVRHPMISLAIQYHGVPGKSGRARKEIGRVEHAPEGDPEALLRGRVTVERDTTGPDGRREVTASFAPDPKFDLLEFRRALHHVAFNYLAHQDGLLVALESRWDPVRRYVRNPKHAEAWGFAQYCPDPGGMPRVVELVRFRSGAEEIVGLQAFGIMFVVDLLNSGRLRKLAVDQNFEYVGPDENTVKNITLTLGEYLAEETEVTAPNTSVHAALASLACPAGHPLCPAVAGLQGVVNAWNVRRHGSFRWASGSRI